MTGKRAEPRIAFVSLVEAGLIGPGAMLCDSRRRWSAQVRADGTIAIGPQAGSIHRMGAVVQGLDACNGWTFWHYEDDGALKPIDELRQEGPRIARRCRLRLRAVEQRRYARLAGRIGATTLPPMC